MASINNKSMVEYFGKLDYDYRTWMINTFGQELQTMIENGQEEMAEALLQAKFDEVLPNIEVGLLRTLKKQGITIKKTVPGQLWTFFSTEEKSGGTGVIGCIIRVYEDKAALVVLMHNNKKIRTRIEPVIGTEDIPFPGRLVAVVERGIVVSPEAFIKASYLGDISENGLKVIKDSFLECQEIFSSSAYLRNLEGNNRFELITEELINLSFKQILFRPVNGDIEALRNLHINLQAIIQPYHEQAILPLIQEIEEESPAAVGTINWNANLAEIIQRLLENLGLDGYRHVGFDQMPPAMAAADSPEFRLEARLQGGGFVSIYSMDSKKIEVSGEFHDPASLTVMVIDRATNRLLFMDVDNGNDPSDRIEIKADTIIRNICFSDSFDPANLAIFILEKEL